MKIKAIYKPVKTAVSVILSAFWVVGCSDSSGPPPENVMWEYSRAVVSDTVYNDVYRQALDSVRSWVANCLHEYTDCRLGEWGIDSLICFNNAGDKCGMALWTRTHYSEATADYINYFNGVRIKGHWYFFRGPSIMLPRQMFREDMHQPMAPRKLHEISMKLIYAPYLRRTPTGKSGTSVYDDWTINEDFFGDLTSVAWCVGCKTKREWDSAYLYWVGHNWRLKDTTDCALE